MCEHVQSVQADVPKNKKRFKFKFNFQMF